MPTEPGTWWRTDNERPVQVYGSLTTPPVGKADVTYHYLGDNRVPRLVTPDGRWLAPVLTPDEADALRARVAAAERERDEARAALRHLQDETHDHAELVAIIDPHVARNDDDGDTRAETVARVFREVERLTDVEVRLERERDEWRTLAVQFRDLAEDGVRRLLGRLP